MNKRILISIVLSTCCFLGIFAQEATNDTLEYRQGEMLVKFKSNNVARVSNRARGAKITSDNKTLETILSSIGAESMEQLMPLTGNVVHRAPMRGINGDIVEDRDMSQLFLISFDPKNDVEKAVADLSELDVVEFAEPNYIVKVQSSDGWGQNDPLYAQQWGLSLTNVPQFWAASKTAPNYLGHRPVIAILDTGVDTNHPDLADNIWTNPNEDEDGTDTDRNGFKDDLHGWDFINQTSRIGDYNGHGTHCAGIAAAVGDNGIGIVGVNPDALIMPVTVMQSNGSGDIATIVKGIDYAAANGADVISMSIGSYNYSIAEEQALAKAYSKAVLVAAAGNDGTDIEPKLLGKPMYPAALTFVIGVQATFANGWLACFSNLDRLGPIYTSFDQEKLYNYEVAAPGNEILSTYPGGRYKVMNGTSMACPFIAGVVSRLIQTKDIYSKEILFGDLIHTSGPLISCTGQFLYKMGGLVNTEALFNITEADRTPNMHLVSFELQDSLGDNDGRVDAGEIVDIFPILRNEWGMIRDSVATISLEFGDNEDTTLCEFITNNVKIGCDVSSYGKIKIQNPLRIKMRDEIVDGRIVRLVARVTCPNMSPDYEPEAEEIQFKVENGVELGGTQKEDITLYPGVQYIVTRNWGIPKDRVVTIKAGTTIKIKDNVGISNYGYMLFEGTADSMITITKGDNDLGNVGHFLNDNANYVEFNYVKFDNLTGITFDGHRYNNCIISNCTVNEVLFTTGATFRGCEIYNSKVGCTCSCKCDFCKDNGGYQGWFTSGSTFIETSIHDCIFNHGFGTAERFYHSNFIGNEILYGGDTPDFTTMEGSNCFGNYYDFKGTNNPFYKPGFYSIVFNTTEPEVFYLSKAYIGTANEEVAYKSILDAEDNLGWGTIDVAQMLKYADETAPLCVDYVKVDGYDPQDQADLLPPLGIGRHMIEVVFNKVMDQSVHPMITMGVRPPYTQVSFDEDGRWFDPYTYRAYLTITSRTATDGTNRIRISDYKQKNQNPAFGAAIEKYRYNVLVSAAGSMSTGLMAKPGLGKVTLNWETDSADFDDLMGYNIYRFTIDDDTLISDTIMVNKNLIEFTESEFTDYDVIPGTTYYYFIKEIGTDLVENFVSKTIAATPLTAQKGDANGSLKVDIADVLTEIAYLSNDNPQPFIFEAADVNCDNQVNILDVVGTLRIITAPENNSQSVDEPVKAYCYIHNGKLYVDCPVVIGGVQIKYATVDESQIVTGDVLNGMERLTANVGNNKQIFLAYSMSGAVVPIGLQELCTISEETSICEIVLSTVTGTNIEVILTNSDPTAVPDIPQSPMPFRKGLYNLNGQELMEMPERGIIIIDGKKVKL